MWDDRGSMKYEHQSSKLARNSLFLSQNHFWYYYPSIQHLIKVWSSCHSLRHGILLLFVRWNQFKGTFSISFYFPNFRIWWKQIKERISWTKFNHDKRQSIKPKRVSFLFLAPHLGFTHMILCVVNWYTDNRLWQMRRTACLSVSRIDWLVFMPMSLFGCKTVNDRMCGKESITSRHRDNQM